MFAEKKPGPRFVPRPISIGRMVANRDFVITIDCEENQATIYPSVKEYDMTDAAQADAINRQIVAVVKQLIAKRQATVLPGEPPYRPLIRLRVRPDGTRTYFRVYPLLVDLGVPMNRDNVEE